jgi:hypothetical protein
MRISLAFVYKAYIRRLRALQFLQDDRCFRSNAWFDFATATNNRRLLMKESLARAGRFLPNLLPKDLTPIG